MGEGSTRAWSVATALRVVALALAVTNAYHIRMFAIRTSKLLFLSS